MNKKVRRVDSSIRRIQRSKEEERALREEAKRLRTEADNPEILQTNSPKESSVPMPTTCRQNVMKVGPVTMFSYYYS